MVRQRTWCVVIEHDDSQDNTVAEVKARTLSEARDAAQSLCSWTRSVGRIWPKHKPKRKNKP